MTYEYVCEACGHQWEAEQSIKERPLRDCTECGKSTAKRLVSGGTGFLLKGGGWYADLYSSSSKPAAASDKGESKPESKSSDASPSTDAKSANGSANGKSAAKSSGGSSSTVTAAASAKAG